MTDSPNSSKLTRYAKCGWLECNVRFFQRRWNCVVFGALGGLQLDQVIVNLKAGDEIWMMNGLMVLAMSMLIAINAPPLKSNVRFTRGDEL